jgi:hypothetical protein
VAGVAYASIIDSKVSRVTTHLNDERASTADIHALASSKTCC